MYAFCEGDKICLIQGEQSHFGFVCGRIVYWTNILRDWSLIRIWHNSIDWIYYIGKGTALLYIYCVQMIDSVM